MEKRSKSIDGQIIHSVATTSNSNLQNYFIHRPAWNVTKKRPGSPLPLLGHTTTTSSFLCWETSFLLQILHTNFRSSHQATSLSTMDARQQVTGSRVLVVDSEKSWDFILGQTQVLDCPVSYNIWRSIQLMISFFVSDFCISLLSILLWISCWRPGLFFLLNLSSPCFFHIKICGHCRL